jgi:predicted metal-dependent hydrolase
MVQLSFVFQFNENTLKDYLQKRIERGMSLVITDNSSCMLSSRKEGGLILLRLHRMFLGAGRGVLDEVADYIKGRKKKTPLIRNFIDRNTHLLKKRPPRKVNLRTQGKCYDLRDIYRSVNEEYFKGRVKASITWGAKRPRRAAAKRTLGSYSGCNDLIRINPMLDSKNVPRYFLELVVYHEMLHADIGVKDRAGRRSVHSGEFARREKLFKHYKRAIAWEKKRW